MPGINANKIAKYTASISGVVPVFNEGYQYTVNETSSNGIYTVELFSDEDFTSCAFFDSYDKKFNSLLSVEYLKITNKVISLKSLFNDCDNLVSVNTQGWDTSNVIDMSYMFWFCKSLQEIDVSGFDTRNVNYVRGMFGATADMSLKRIIGLENWDTSKIVEMVIMFQMCKELESLEGIANWDVSKVTDFTGTFRDCDSITSLDLSNWRVSSANNMTQMFYTLDQLTTLNISNWTIDQVTKYDYLITSCDSINTIIMHNSNAISVNKVIERLNYYENGLVLEVDGIDNIYDVNLSTANTKNISIKYNGEIIILNNIAIYVVEIDTPGEIYVPTFNEGFKYDIDIVTSTDIFDGRWVNGSIDISNGQEIPAPDNNYSRTDFVKVRPGIPCGIFSTEGGCLFFYDTNKNFISSQEVGEEGYMSCMTPENCGYIRGIKKNGENDCAYGMIENIAVVSLVSKDLPTKISFENSEALEYVYYLNMSEVNTMNNMFKNCINFKGIKDYTELERMMFGPKLPLRDFNTSNVTDMSYMFYNCNNLTTLDVSNFDTSNVTNMYNIFYNCQSLTSLDVSKWNTGKVINMKYMFQDCHNITTLDVNNFNTNNVTDMSYMFANCESLTSLDVSNFDTSNVIDMQYMFEDCHNITSLNLSNFNTSKVTNMTEMIDECYDLTELNISNWHLNTEVDVTDMFGDTNVLTNVTMNNSDYNSVNKIITQLPTRTTDSIGTLNMAGIDDISQVDTTTAESKFWNVSNQYKIAEYKFDNTIYDLMPEFYEGFTYTYEDIVEGNVTTRTIYSNSLPTKISFGQGNTEAQPRELSLLGVEYLNITNTTKIIYNLFARCQNLQYVNGVNDWDISGISDLTTVFYYCNSLTQLDLSNWDTSNVTNMYCMFRGCESLTSLDLSNWDTGNVTDMSYMFADCPNLTTLDVSNFDTSNVTDMSWMFYKCQSLTQLDVSKWDTSNVTTMMCMFSTCHSLASLDVSKWATSNVISMESMFSYDYMLTTLDVSNWNIGKVVNIFNIFGSCQSLTQLDVSNWDTSNVENMGYMFYDCQSLTSLDLSKWDTSNVIYMFNTFCLCESLTQLDVSNWKTSNVITMEAMFGLCNSLTTVGDLTNWNTSNVTNMKSVFYGCANLTQLDVSNWDISNVTDMSLMFYDCTNLTSITMNNSDYNSVNKIITELPARTTDSIGALNVTGVDDINQVNINDAKTKFWIINNPEKIKSIKINNKNINKIYKGLLKIKKIYLG